ncbi:unnamed protein product [Rotaria sp. Silwood2]|nr:unnamed protein product [Rotaria sp. Silwood2]CAF2949827.1 unnamed protein product [Rotaria sp. Silwood2]CAF3253874.1 unnamed protein product [Rotaria sp. Silwood2]CAF3310387.1 unnamed protein product [Rotaria sp. Silwood2]CAF4064285.1 unnamed protein product [Rotaria sp. Silwood2]
MSLSVSPLVIAQKYLTRYGMTTYVTLGNIGLVFNMLIFSQPAHRRNSCSLYILGMSFCSCIGLNSAIIPIIYALDHPNLLSYSLIFCKLQYYVRHVFSQSMRTFLVLACADRYATSSNRVCIRSFSRYQVAIRIIPLVILFWLSLGIFPAMLYTNNNGECDAQNGLSNILYSTYIMTFLGIFPLVSLITFGILIVLNLKEVRARAHFLKNRNAVTILRKRDRNMIRMLLIELIIYICTTIPTTVVLIYKAAVQNKVYSGERQDIESFIFFVGRTFLLYFNNSLPFWIYLSASRSFRLELKNLFFKWFTFIKQQNTSPTLTH